jgi:F-type H+-transporting ATPase subunit b
VQDCKHRPQSCDDSASPRESGPDTIFGKDRWTLAFQTVNVIVLICLLGWFLFRPVTELVARRQGQANKLLADAAVTREQANEARADLERARANIAAERDMLLADARKAAEIERAALLARANEEIVRLRAEADAATSRDRVAMEKTLIDRTRELSVEIARRLLGRLTAAAGLDVFLAGLCQQVRTLSPQERAAFAQGREENDSMEVVTAAPLSAEQAERVRGAIAEAFGSDPVLVFRSDPVVIAGIELHSRHVVLRNSWRGDLDRIREELNRVGANQPR